MWGRTRKRRTTNIDTLIGQHAEVMGDVKFSGGLYIDGTIKGNVYAENDGHSTLSLSERGTIEGEVNVPYIVLNGVVVGDVHSSEHIELSSRARVTGNVYYSLIEMAVGSIPATIATVVMTIGWARLWPASQIASFFGMPWFIISTAKSTRRIEFLATIPKSIRIPMRTNSETGCPAMCKATAAPSGASSSEPMFTNGARNLR